MKPAADAVKTVLSPAHRWALGAVAVMYIAAAWLLGSLIEPEVLALALSLPLWLIAVLLGLSLVNYGLRAWRWVMLTNALNLGVPVWPNVLYYISGYSLTATPGKAGEAVRLWFLKSGHGIGFSRSAPLMVADRVLDIWAVMLLTLVSFSGFQAYRWYGLALVLLVAAISLPVIRPQLLEPILLGCTRWTKRYRRLLVRMRRVLRTMSRLSNWRTYGYTMLPSVAGWWAEAIALYLILHHLGADVSLANAVFVFSFSMIVGAVSMLPGGLGGTEASMVLLLSALGVPIDIALVATAIVRVTTFWFAVALGLLISPAAIKYARR